MYRTLDAVTSTTVVRNSSILPTFTFARYATAGEVVRLAGVTAGPKGLLYTHWLPGRPQSRSPDTCEFALRTGNFSAGYCRPRHL